MKRSTRKIAIVPLAIVFSMAGLSGALLLGCRSSGDAYGPPPPVSIGSPDSMVQPQSDEIESAGMSAATVTPVRYEDALTGGRVFTMYCGACHNPRALGERPFASYENATNHMRVRANLTGEEYRKLMQFLRYWHDIPPQIPPVEPSPKRLIFSQPLSELRPEAAAPQQAAPLPEVLPPPEMRGSP